jgi:hypothetical protein
VQTETPPPEEIAPFLLLHVEAGEVKCAQWQAAQGGRAVALFLGEESARAYRDAAGLAGWQVYQPAREALLTLIDALVQTGVFLAVLDPDLRGGRRLFDLREVLRAARSPAAGES